MSPRQLNQALLREVVKTPATPGRIAELLTQGADPNARRILGTSALALAAEQGPTESVEDLIAGGACVNGVGGEVGSRTRSPLARAIREGRSLQAMSLLRAGADFEEIVSERDGGIVLWLFGGEHGPTRPDPALVETVLARGGRADLTDREGRSTLMRAIARQMPEETLDLLLAAGAPLEHRRQNDNRTALGIAVSMGSHRAVRWLLANGADPASGLETMATDAGGNLNTQRRMAAELETASLDVKTAAAVSVASKAPRL